MTEDNNEIATVTENVVTENQNEISDLSEDNIKELMEKELEKIRTYHPLKLLSMKEIKILTTFKEEELTDFDKRRIKLATIRLNHHKYSGTDYTPKEKKKIKAKRKLVKASRKANR